MKKILYHSFYPDDASAFYRSTAVFPYIEHAELQITQGAPNSFAGLCGYDTLFVQRPCEQYHLNLIKLAKDTGLKVIIDYDDDPLHLPNDNPMWDYYEKHKATIIDSVIAADEVWVSTEGIEKAFKFYNRNIQVIPNAHNDYIFPVENKKSFVYNKKAMWRGGHSHLGDMYDIGVPEKIIDMVNSNKNWTFQFLGQRFEYLEKRCGDNYIAMGGASTVQFYKLMHEENPCVFFYPLADTVFNRSKSNIAWLESTYSGAAFFGSKNLSEFDLEFIEDFKYIENSLDEYHKEIYKQCNKSAWEYILENLLLSKVNNKRIERLLI